MCTLALIKKACRNKIMQQPNKPSVFDFLDAAQFLQSYFEWRKSLKNSFTIAEWSEELNFGSKVTLRFILKKMRRISERSADIFKKNLFNDESQSKCFDILVSYSQARSASERKAFGTELLYLHRQQMSYKTVDAFVANRNIFGPMVLTLLTFKDFKKNVTTLSYLLKVKPDIIETILKDFENDSVITRNADGDYEFSGDILKIPDNPDLKKFYEYWIEQSKKALSLPIETRKYRAVNFALTNEEYAKVLEKLDEYASSLLNQFNHSHLENRTLYMFESALFPVTERLSSINAQ